MLNLFGSTSSVSYQFLVLESPLFQVIFMKNHAKNPLFEGLFYNLKGLELFSKTNFVSSWVSEGLKFDRICILCYPFGFWHRLFVPTPLRLQDLHILIITHSFPKIFGIESMHIVFYQTHISGNTRMN